MKNQYKSDRHRQPATPSKAKLVLLANVPARRVKSREVDANGFVHYWVPNAGRPGFHQVSMETFFDLRKYFLN